MHPEERTVKKLLIAMLMMAATASADVGQKLDVVGNGIEVRQEPNTSSPTVAVISQGKQLVEIERKGKWVHVRLDESGEKTGWLLDLFVSPADPG